MHLGRLSKPDDLVFASIEGKSIDPGVLNHNFARTAKRAGLHDVRFHDLRHTFASLMLLRGASQKSSRRHWAAQLGSPYNGRVHSNMIEGKQSNAITLLDGVLAEAKNGISRKININLTPRTDIKSHKSHNSALRVASSIR